MAKTCKIEHQLTTQIGIFCQNSLQNLTILEMKTFQITWHPSTQGSQHKQMPLYFTYSQMSKPLL